MSNELHINKVEKVEEIDGVTNYGMHIPFSVQSLEKYGGPSNSEVYTMSEHIGISSLIVKANAKAD